MKDSSLCSDMNQAAQRTVKPLMLWTGLWLLSLALFTFGPMFIWDFNTVLTLIMLVVNVLVGLKMILANKAHLESLDELQQRIMLEAMALSLGITMIAGAAYGVCHAVKLIEHQPNASSLLFVMGITYGLGTVMSRRKYL